MDKKEILIKEWLQNIGNHCMVLHCSSEEKRKELKELFEEESMMMVKTIGEC
jgi:hypothetical protein